MIKLVKFYTVRVIYKSGSGYAHEFDVGNFEVKNGVVYKWNAMKHSNSPLIIGAEYIEAIYCIKHKYIIVLADWIKKLLRISQ